MLLFQKIRPHLEDYEPIVVMGRGHSGTRVLGWALHKLQVRMGATDENPAADAQDLKFTDAIKKIVARNIYDPVTAPPKESDLKLFKKAVSHYMNWIPTMEPYWGWKFPETYMIGNYVEATFPKAKYIHLLRDGRDIAFKRHNTDRVDKLGYHILKQTQGLNEPHHIQAAMSWAFQVKRFDEFAETLPSDRVIKIKFEDMCTEPLMWTQKICDFLNIEMNSDCRGFLDTVDPKKISQYRNESPEQIEQVETVIGADLAQYGYLSR